MIDKDGLVCIRIPQGLPHKRREDNIEMAINSLGSYKAGSLDLI